MDTTISSDEAFKFICKLVIAMALSAVSMSIFSDLLVLFIINLAILVTVITMLFKHMDAIVVKRMEMEV